MAQHFLDPSDSTTVGEWRPDGPLPRRVREEFGRYPNIDEWKPGDLLLFHIPHKTPLVSRLIIKAQNGVYDPEHARWHHAAVYVGDGFLCEANMIGGVQYRPLHRYVGKHWIRVRRDEKLSDAERYKLAIRAMTRLREAYGFGEIVRLGIRLLTGFWKPAALALESKGVICSRLYELAYWSAAGRVLHDTEGRPIIPAELSRTKILTDVPVCWRRISRA